MGWTIEGLIPSRIKRSFFSPKHLDQLWIPPSLLINDYLGSFLEVKQPGHEIDHSPPLLLRLRMSGTIFLLLHMPSWCGQGQLYLQYAGELKKVKTIFLFYKMYT